MDDTIAADIHRRMSIEQQRSEAPSGFPQLPDLPIGRYTDPDFYRLELDRVFRRTWLFAGHVSEWPEPGSYRALDIPMAPVIVVRGEDGALRAFLNTCRHRGAPVVRDEEGRCRHLVCQFHSWSYDLAGRLVGVPDSRNFVGLDPEKRSLTELRCENWGNLVFISLWPDVPDLMSWLGELDHVYGDLVRAPDLRRVGSPTRYEQICNWKVLVDAFIEDYHVNTVHRHSLAPLLDPRQTVVDMFPGGHGGLHSPYRQDAGGRKVWAVDLARMDVHEQYRTDVQSFNVFPNFLIANDETSGFFTVQWWPLAVDRSRMDVTWYGVDWGDGPRPESWEIKLQGAEMLMQEDLANTEPIQRSLVAAAHPGIPLSYAERRIWHFHANLDRLIGPDQVPPDLHVPNLLHDLVRGPGPVVQV